VEVAVVAQSQKICAADLNLPARELRGGTGNEDFTLGCNGGNFPHCIHWLAHGTLATGEPGHHCADIKLGFRRNSDFGSG
jgi:hypothetical protein